MSDEFDWDFDEEQFERDYEKSRDRYVTPITSHECSKACTDNVVAYYHEIEDLFDDFALSLKQRETMRMEIIRSRGRDEKERTLIRMFQGVETQLYYLRMQTVTQLTREPMGQVEFQERGDCEAYYNYAIDIFQFHKSLKVVPEDDPLGLFEVSDEFDDLFGDLNDDLFDIDDLFDTDEDDDEGLWD